MDAIEDLRLRAVAHPSRRAILRLVWNGERTATEIAERCGVSAPAASQHLKTLREAKLVTVRRDATRRLYRVNIEEMRRLQAFLEDFWAPRIEDLASAAERLDAQT